MMRLLPPWGNAEKKAWTLAIRGLERAVLTENISAYDREQLMQIRDRVQIFATRREALAVPEPVKTEEPPRPPGQAPSVIRLHEPRVRSRDMPTRVDELGLSPLIVRALQERGVETIQQLRGLRRADLVAMDGIGSGRARLVRYALATCGDDHRQMLRRARITP